MANGCNIDIFIISCNTNLHHLLLLNSICIKLAIFLTMVNIMKLDLYHTFYNPDPTNVAKNYLFYFILLALIRLGSFLENFHIQN